MTPLVFAVSGGGERPIVFHGIDSDGEAVTAPIPPQQPRAVLRRRVR